MYKNRFIQYLWIDLYASRRNFKFYVQIILNFFEIQQENFFHFINIGLQTEFKNNQIWFKTSRWERAFYSESFCFEVPTQNYQESIRNNKTYSTHVFIPRLVYDLQNKKIYFEWRILGNLPILTQ